jgi:hypothetical protein
MHSECKSFVISYYCVVVMREVQSFSKPEQNYRKLDLIKKKIG